MVFKTRQDVRNHCSRVYYNFGVGSQFFSNLAYSLNQGILQTSFGIGSQYLIIPSVLANFTFALGIPLGHTLTHKYGFKRNYLCFVFIFLIGSILGLLSFNLIILSIAKMIQSFSSGVLFFTLLPKLFLNFPKQYRNVFLLMVIVGLFGSNALGGLSGSLSLELDRWHWLFCSKYHLRNIMLNSRQRHIKKK